VIYQVAALISDSVFFQLNLCVHRDELSKSTIHSRMHSLDYVLLYLCLCVNICACIEMSLARNSEVLGHVAGLHVFVTVHVPVRIYALSMCA